MLRNDCCKAAEFFLLSFNYSNFFGCKEMNRRKTRHMQSMIPLGQTHSLTRSNHYFHSMFLLFYDITETFAKIMITTSRECGSVQLIRQ